MLVTYTIGNTDFESTLTTADKNLVNFEYLEQVVLIKHAQHASTISFSSKVSGLPRQTKPQVKSTSAIG